MINAEYSTRDEFGRSYRAVIIQARTIRQPRHTLPRRRREYASRHTPWWLLLLSADVPSGSPPLPFDTRSPP